LMGNDYESGRDFDFLNFFGSKKNWNILQKFLKFFKIFWSENRSQNAHNSTIRNHEKDYDHTFFRLELLEIKFRPFFFMSFGSFVRFIILVQNHRIVQCFVHFYPVWVAAASLVVVATSAAAIAVAAASAAAVVASAAAIQFDLQCWRWNYCNQKLVRKMQKNSTFLHSTT
jgi:hypothetical protein